jgi:hypothetical protein
MRDGLRTCPAPKPFDTGGSQCSQVSTERLALSLSIATVSTFVSISSAFCCQARNAVGFGINCVALGKEYFLRLVPMLDCH